MWYSAKKSQQEMSLALHLHNLTQLLNPRVRGKWEIKNAWTDRSNLVLQVRGPRDFVRTAVWERNVIY